MAFIQAEQGKTVVVISSGDAGIYGMTPLIYEMRKERGSDVEVCSLPGISAFQKAASLLGGSYRTRPVCHLSLGLDDTLGDDRASYPCRRHW